MPRLADILRAAPDPGWVRSALPWGGSGAARRCRRAGLFLKCLSYVATFTSFALFSPAVAQEYSERTALACMQIDAEAAYTTLQDLGWRRILPSELTAEDKAILSTVHFSGAVARAEHNLQENPTFEQAVKISKARVEQQIRRIQKGSTVLSGAYFKSPATETLVEVAAKTTRSVTITSCTFFLSPGATAAFLSPDQGQTHSAKLENRFRLPIGHWKNYVGNVGKELKVHLWNAEKLAEAIGEPFPVGMIAFTQTWQNSREE